MLKLLKLSILDDLSNIDKTCFDDMVNHIYPSELLLNNANSSNTETLFLDLHFNISDGFVSSKIYDKRDDFDFDIVNFLFLDGDIPRAISYGVHISRPIRFVPEREVGGSKPTAAVLCP